MKKAKNKPETQALRVLILEDNPADAELVEHELRRAGIVFTSLLTEGKREFKKTLKEFQPQIILSDFKLPRFDGLAALEIARHDAPDIPFIFVSGSIGEEQAIETLTLGASDYILKDNLTRLGPAIKRVVEEIRLKLEKKNINEELRRHVDELQLLAEAAEHFVNINNLDKIYNYLAQMISKISGADYLMLSLYDEKLQALRPKIISGFEPFREIIRQHIHTDLMQMVFHFKDMRQDDFSDFVSRRLLPVRDGLYGLCNRKISQSACRTVEKLLTVDSLHIMGFSWENKLFGGFSIWFKQGNKLKNPALIEALANQAAVSIKRLLAEQSLHESEKKYRTLVTQSPDGIFIIDLQGNFLSVNQAMCTGLKYSETEFLAMNIRNIVPEPYLDLHKKRLAEIMKGNPQNEAAEYEVQAKDGEIRHIAILSAPYYKDDQLVGFQGIARDITEKKKMEIRLRESEEYYRTLVETSPDAIIIVDAGGRVTFASQKTFKIFAVPAQTSLAGLSIFDFVEPDDIPRVQGRMVEILSGRSFPDVREYRLLQHDRRPFWGEISSAPLRDTTGENIGLLLVCRDVSERKQAEAALRKSEEKYRLITDNTAETITVLDLGLKFTYISPAIFKLRGYTVKEAMQLTLQQSMTPESLAKIQAILAEEMTLESSGSADPLRSRTLEIQEYCKDGSIIWIENTISFLRDPQGQAVGFVAVSKDINERKRDEEQIAYQAGLLQNVSDAIVATDKEGRISMWNRAAENIYGWKAEEALGWDFHALIDPEYRFQSREEVIGKLDREGSWSGEIIHRLQGGKQIPVYSTITILKDSEGNPTGMVSVNHDISERKQAEQQIYASLKEKEVLLQEIHHRVKNNLQIISGLLTLQADQSAGKALAEIFQESQDRIRSIALVHEKLYKSHNLAEIEFDDYLRSLTENLLSTHDVAAGRISIDYKMEKILFTIEKAIPLGLIVNELITNALKHAFPEGRQGKIHITLRGGSDRSRPHSGTSPVTVENMDSAPSGDTARRAPMYELTVADDGVGLPPGQDPEQEKTLGMKLVSILAKQLQVELKVKTGPGTEFSLIFPGLPVSKNIKDLDHDS